jgi:cell division protein FtsQ
VSRVAISADRRFHRAHVKPARKRGRIRNLVWPVVKCGLLAALASLVIYRGQAVLAGSALLQIDHIVVNGNHRMASGDVLAILAGLRGENIVWSDLDGWRDRLLASPWVREAIFRRSLPSTVEVLVGEREPVGIARLKGQLFLVDDRGSVIDVYGPQYADFDLPIIDGLTASNRTANVADTERGELAARVIASLRAKPSIAHRLSQVDVTDQHNAAVILNGDQAVIYVGEDRFLPRIESYLELSAALRERVPDVDYVDLRFDDRIYVRPTGKPGKTAASVRGGPLRSASVEQTRSGPKRARR